MKCSIYSPSPCLISLLPIFFPQCPQVFPTTSWANTNALHPPYTTAPPFTTLPATCASLAIHLSSIRTFCIAMSLGHLRVRVAVHCVCSANRCWHPALRPQVPPPSTWPSPSTLLFCKASTVRTTSGSCCCCWCPEGEGGRLLCIEGCFVCVCLWVLVYALSLSSRYSVSKYPSLDVYPSWTTSSAASRPATLTHTVHVQYHIQYSFHNTKLLNLSRLMFNFH